MKKKISIIIMTVFCSVFFGCWGAAADDSLVPPEIKADAGLILNLENNQVLWEKEGWAPMAPASLIKLLNILTAYPYIDFSDKASIGPLVDHLYAGQLLGLHSGDIVETGELIYGMMLYSANDAAVAMADYLTSDEDFYCKLMDKKAWALGAVDTVSINSNGYSDTAQKTTAYDLAIIGAAFMSEDKLAAIAGTASHTFAWFEPKKELPLTNINRFIFSYAGATGLKTGTTDMAGKCLIATAQRDGDSLLVVALNSSQRYEDCTKMMDYGFALLE